MRKTQEKLQDIMIQRRVSRIWSWSRVNCFGTSPYEYYLKYIIKAPEDIANSIYTTTGGMSHEILERFYTGQIQYGDMIGDFEDAWLTAFTIADLKFDRNDEEHNQKLAEKYHDCLAAFFKHHSVIPYKVVMEPFVLTDIGGNLFQGYIDCCFKDKEGYTNIIDFKTSSIYKGAKADNEAGQLVIYAIGLNQCGVPLDNIKIAWNFLKYCTIEYQQANGTVKTRDVERVKIGESLQSNAKMWLKKLGYEDRLDYYLMSLLDTNSIECLPQDVQAKYKISDCYVYVPLTQELVDKWEQTIISRITDIELREKDYTETKDKGVDEESASKVFWDTEESVKANSYYFSTLCGYSAAWHKPYKQYLEKLEQAKSGDDLFSGIGEDTVSYNVVVSTPATNNNTNEIDLSWLDTI